MFSMNTNLVKWMSIGKGTNHCGPILLNLYKVQAFKQDFVKNKGFFLGQNSQKNTGYFQEFLGLFFTEIRAEIQ